MELKSNEVNCGGTFPRDYGQWESGFTETVDGITYNGYAIGGIVHTESGIYMSLVEDNQTNPETDTTGSWRVWFDKTVLYDRQVLDDIAFWIDINGASSLGSTRVDRGGNMQMMEYLFAQRQNVLMDANGNYCHLNRNDGRYTEDGELIIDTSTGQLLSKWANADMMIIIPEYYGRVLPVDIGGTTKYYLYLSAIPLPGGFTIPRQVVGVTKATNISGAMRSVPGYVSDNSATIETFWSRAQARSKNHGIANLDYQNYLLWYMMGKYGYRDSQGCKTSDGTLVWGVGLDGTENTSGSSTDGWGRQYNIKHGQTIRLGLNDGNVAVTDAAGGTAHSVNVAGFCDAWGQRWEDRGGLCSVGDNVYCWRHNWLPSGTPTDDTFANVDCVKLIRSNASGVYGDMNIVPSGYHQGVYMISKGSLDGVSYNDYYWYASGGQLWIFGGDSYYGSNCGLAFAYSNNGWSNSYSGISARLAYYGSIKRVTTSQLAALLAS